MRLPEAIQFVPADVMHARLHPKRVVFRFPVLFLSCNLDLLKKNEPGNRWFSFNRLALFSLYEGDYLPGVGGDISERLRIHLKNRGVELPNGRVELITVPRLLGYVFNPVSFYRCYDSQEKLSLVVAEVNNTFGETHLYILPEFRFEGAMEDQNYRRRIEREKVFHVSPFLSRTGKYLFSMKQAKADSLENGDASGTFDIRVDLEQDQRLVFVSRMWGKVAHRSLGTWILARPTLALSPWLTMPRIFWEATKMTVSRSFKVFPRPLADSQDTIATSAPGLVDRIARSFVRKALGRLKRGQLTLSYPNGESETYGDPQAQHKARIHVRNMNFFSRILFSGDIGFGESFTEHEWESDNLTSVIELFAANLDVLDDRSFWSTTLARVRNRLLHLGKNNNKLQSEKNIQAHYDLSNEFFETFLDESMSYSSAYFTRAEDTLKEAQERKITMLLDKLRLQPGMQLLEIGSGWGSLAIIAAQRHGVKVKSITLSKEQLEYAKARRDALGLQDQISFELCDYRHLEGQFDRIISVEMLEAVGRQYYREFFSTLERVLAPDGLVALQVISMPEHRYEGYRKSCDWIQKYIFPGGETPSAEALLSAMRQSSRLFVEDMENIALHYARTLREWAHRFQAKRDHIRNIGFDERFLRMWEYYLAYCEAGFSMRALSTYQLVLTREGNRSLAGVPGYPEKRL